MRGAPTVVLAVYFIFTSTYIVDLAPTNQEDSSNANTGRILIEDELELGNERETTVAPGNSRMQSRILRLSPAGANLTNYSLQWIPLLTVLTSPTVYYPPFG